MSDNILVSVSGGRTSGFMAVYLKERYPDKNLLFVFANTGKEREETLIFLRRIEEHFSIPIVWVEAKIIQEKGIGTGYEITAFKQASRKGEPFKALIQKYGLPSKMWRHCTRELKEKPITVYAKEILGEYREAVGIRADERHRIKSDPIKYYPLVDINVTKQFINDWWKSQPFDLELKESEGNCDFCFLKSKKKRINLLKSGLNVDWWKEMEESYSDDKRPMFDVRNGITVNDLVQMAQDQSLQMDFSFDIESSCFCGN